MGSNLRLDQLGEDALKEGRSPLQKARDNIAAIELLNGIEVEGRPAAIAEQRQLALYTGWGGIKGAFPDQLGRFASGFEEIGARLKALLTSEEYERAQRSIQYAHYTSKLVIDHMWALARKLGVTGGSILEPGMGVGHFAGLMPSEIADRKGTRYTGIEMENISARIAKLLYPRENIVHADFSKYALQENSVDFVIGNPPFGNIPIGADPLYAKHKFLIHDYFFAKSMDALKPGGILMFVTSAGTMNKVKQKAREYLADRAELVGAVRLPGGRQGAFAESSNTQVTTDIVVLRKRLEDEAAGDRSWVETEQVAYPSGGGRKSVAVSRYFRRHPEMVIGEQGLYDTLIPNRYGVVMPMRVPQSWFPMRLAETMDAFPEGIWAPETSRLPRVQSLEEREKDGTFYVGTDGTLFQVHRGLGVEVAPRGKRVEGRKSATKADIALIKDLIPVRDALRDVMQANVANDAQAGNLARAKLNDVYDKFAGKRGPLNREKVTIRRPTAIQLETRRNDARENARLLGEPWDEGSLQPGPAFFDKTMTQRARIRKAAKERALAQGQTWNEGSFDPDSVPDNEIRSFPNLDPFRSDPEYFRLASIENKDGSKRLVFRENTIVADRAPTIRSAKDAMFSVLGRTGKFDINEIAALYKRAVPETIRELGDDIYELPLRPGSWVTKEEYLSGDVKTKIADARKEAEKDPRFDRNVKALAEVIPRDLVPAEISMRIGGRWIPPATLQAFARHLGFPPQDLSQPFDGSPYRFAMKGSPIANSKWAVVDSNGLVVVPAQDIFATLMNKAPAPTVWKNSFDADSGQKKKLVDQTLTALSKTQYNLMKAEWDTWLEGETALSEELAGIYNEKFRRTVARQYSGEYVTTPGVVKGWRWRPFQKDVIARIIQSGNTYMAHAVGAGKTAAMVSAAMELKRLGLISKPMFVVPRAMLRQFAVEFVQQYPSANVMVADEHSFIGDARREFIANVGLDNTLDGVVVSHSSFMKIPLSHEFLEHVIAQERDALVRALESIKEAGGPGVRYTRADIQRQLEKLDQQLSESRETDQVFTFEEMGVDQLFIDEAHNFRKLGLFSSMKIKGIDPTPSQRAKDLYRKIQYLRTLNPNRGVVFASGTPVVNTMGEAYNISRYLQDGELKRLGFGDFDSWSATFGDTVNVFEPDAAGRYKYVERFAQFVNRPELMNILHQVVDYISPEQLAENVVRPRVGKDGKGRSLVAVPMSQEQQDYQRVLAARLKEIEARKRPPEKGEDIQLTVIGDGRKMAIDMRLIDPGARNDPASKLNTAIGKVFEIWKASEDQPFHDANEAQGAYEARPASKGPATQIIFVSLGLTGDFSVTRWIRAELQRRGVPAGEIADINDYKNTRQRQRLYNDMNEGKIRVLMGHPETLGTGVNVQRRLIAIHNLDPLWFPALDEQRVGRILRQGNKNPVIQVFDYATEGSFDTQMWTMMKTKSSFIHQFWSDSDVREMADITMDDYYEKARAIVSGDPRLEQLAQMQRDIRTIQNERIAHERKASGTDAARAETKIELEVRESGVRLMRAMEADRQDIAGDKFAITVIEGENRRTITKRPEANKFLRGAVMAAQAFRGASQDVGSIAGFNIEMQATGEVAKGVQAAAVFVRSPSDRMAFLKFFLTTAQASPLQAVENKIRSIPDTIARLDGKIDDLRRTLDEFKKQGGGAAFPRLEELQNLKAKAKALQDEMAAKAVEASSADDVTIRSRQADALPAGMPVHRVSAIVGRISRRWGESSDLPDVRVLRSWRDLPSDLRGRLQLGADQAPRAMHISQGHRNFIYLFADEMENAAAVRSTLLHEAVGHFSMQEMMGARFPEFLARVWQARDNSSVRPIAEEVRRLYPDAGPDEQAEEIIARIAERGVDVPIMSRIYAAVRDFLRSLGFRIDISHNDIRAILRQADRRIMSGRDRRNKAEFHRPEPDYSQSAQQTKIRFAMREAGEPGKPGRPVRPPLVEPTRPVESVFRLLSVPFGGRDAKGDLRISKPMQEAAGRVLRDIRPAPDGRFAWLEKPLEIARHGWLNRYGTPREFISREREQFSHQMEIMQELTGFLEGFAREGIAAEDAAALQEVLEGKELNDERLSRIAKPIRERIDAYGRQLVELGLLPKEAYLSNLGKYLHRSYRKYEFDAPKLVQWNRRRERARRKTLHGDELMARGRTHPVTVGRLLKDIPPKERKAALEARRWEIFDQMDRTGRVHRRWYRPAGLLGERLIPQETLMSDQLMFRGEWNLSPAKGTPGRMVLRQDWTEEERAEMGEIRDARFNLIKTYELLAHDISTGKFFQDISQEPAWFSRVKPTEGNIVDAADVLRFYSTVAGVDWVRVPDTRIPKSGAKRWGALAGGYLKAPIWRDLYELEKMQTPGAWGWLLRQWKKNKTARSPTVHFNNVMGNIILSELYDFTPGDLVRAITEYAKNGEIFQEAVREGIFQGNFVNVEINRIDINRHIESVLREVEAADSSGPTGMQKVWRLIEAIDDKITGAYRWEDEIFRLTSYMRDRDMGATAAEAGQNAIDRFLNYDIRAPWPNALRRTVLPFLSYSYAFFPQWLKAMSSKPWKLAKIATLGFVLQALSYELAPGDEEEERRVMADRDTGITWAGLPKMLRLPFTDGDDPVYIGMTRILPGGGIADIDKGQIGLPEWMMASGPILMAGEVFLNRVSFTGQDIVNSTDTELEAAQKRLAYLWRATMPNAPYVPGSWDLTRLLRAASDETDMFGREYSLPVAAIRLFGPKLYPHDVDSQRTMRMLEITRETTEWRRKVWQLQSDLARNRISDEVYRRKMESVSEAMVALHERARRLWGN